MDRSVGSLWTQSVVGVRGPGVKEIGKASAGALIGDTVS